MKGLYSPPYPFYPATVPVENICVENCAADSVFEQVKYPTEVRVVGLSNDPVLSRKSKFGSLSLNSKAVPLSLLWDGLQRAILAWRSAVQCLILSVIR